MLSAKSNPKVFWKYINSKLKIKNLIPPLVNSCDNEVISENDKAKVLNLIKLKYLTPLKKLSQI